MTTRNQAPRPGRIVAAIGAAALALTVGAGTILAGPTRGPIPADAIPPDGGQIDFSRVPDYIPAVGPDGADVGWVSADLAVPVKPVGDRRVIPVYADDLRTVVGHMVAMHGFVPVGTELGPLLDALPTQPLPEELADSVP